MRRAAMLMNAATQPVAPDLHSRWYPGYAAFMRDNRPAESWLAYRQTKFAMDHFHADQGSFTLFAKGVPLMLHFGSMYSPDTGQAVYQSRICWNMQEPFPLKPRLGNDNKDSAFYGMMYNEQKFEPWSAEAEMFGAGKSPTDAQGEVKTFRTLPAADYVQGQSDVSLLMKHLYYPDAPFPGSTNDRIPTVPTTPFSWQRRVLFAKAQADADPCICWCAHYFLCAARRPPPASGSWQKS